MPHRPRQRRQSESEAEQQRRARRALEAAQRRRSKERRAALRRTVPADPAARVSPFVLFRPARLSELLDVDRSTIWRMRRNGTLPEPITIGSITGWTYSMIEDLLAWRSAGR